MGENNHDPSWPGTIGMAMSGGGYRAAAFHLGSLSYLDRLGVLGNLDMISTVSGGTFTGAYYALSLVEGKPFARFFVDYYGLLRDTNLVELGLQRLVEIGTERASGRQTLILAMADVYAERFFAAPDGSPYRLSAILDADIPMHEIVFNATEFRQGRAFRFQRSQDPDARIGSEMFSVPVADAGKIRVADIVAASSCFPGGFEPMAFPDDFDWPGDRIPEKTRQLFSEDESGAPRPVALMDGGIYDNQGIESLLFADERDADDLNLFIISDVDSTGDDLYPMPSASERGGFTVATLARMAWLIAGVCALTAVLVGIETVLAVAHGTFRPFWDALRLLVPFVMAAAVAVVLWRIRVNLHRELLPRVPQVGARVDAYLRQLRTGQLKDMVELRYTSLMTMSSKIFLTRIRALAYGLIYGDLRYEGKRVSNLITHLRQGEPVPSVPGMAPPSDALRRVATVAATMPTILWFENNEQLQCVCAAGQATLCFNLIKHIARRYGHDPQAFPEPVQRAWRQLHEDWSLLQDDPHALLRDLLPDAGLPEPPAR